MNERAYTSRCSRVERQEGAVHWFPLLASVLFTDLAHLATRCSAPCSFKQEAGDNNLLDWSLRVLSLRAPPPVRELTMSSLLITFASICHPFAQNSYQLWRLFVPSDRDHTLAFHSTIPFSSLVQMSFGVRYRVTERSLLQTQNPLVILLEVMWTLRHKLRRTGSS